MFMREIHLNSYVKQLFPNPSFVLDGHLLLNLSGKARYLFMAQRGILLSAVTCRTMATTPEGQGQAAI